MQSCFPNLPCTKSRTDEELADITVRDIVLFEMAKRYSEKMENRIVFNENILINFILYKQEFFGKINI